MGLSAQKSIVPLQNQSRYPSYPTHSQLVPSQENQLNHEQSCSCCSGRARAHLVVLAYKPCNRPSCHHSQHTICKNNQQSDEGDRSSRNPFYRLDRWWNDLQQIKQKTLAVQAAPLGKTQILTSGLARFGGSLWGWGRVEGWRCGSNGREFIEFKNIARTATKRKLMKSVRGNYQTTSSIQQRSRPILSPPAGRK